MDLHNIITFIAVATLLVISPGPNGFLIAKTVPMSGQKAGFANVGGFVAAFYVHGTLSIFGISILLVQSAVAFTLFKMLGAAYLIWIGIKAIRSAINQKAITNIGLPQETQKKISIRNAFLEGFVTNALNPKVSMFYLAAFPQFITLESNAFSAYALVSAHSLVNLIWFSIMVLALSRVKSAANSAKFRKWLNSITGVVFIGFGAKLALMKSS
ncbi:LysE family translocator [Neptunomonas phycophila]|uniref:LysE family translocator n=1 Tax=Neptunomonas phycophila TaxID=1572645 RepID=A0AAW7XI92_9GAMM|nr:LysE family translocator [Neptunomonas phycophila]MDO6452595.1 LysE family translocator [Neptunomonas phycophila]